MIKEYILYNSSNIVTSIVRCDETEISHYNSMYCENTEGITVDFLTMTNRIDQKTNTVIPTPKALRREAIISNIVVTTATGKAFDGDEKSQSRMLKAIGAADIAGKTTTTWRLADNTDVEVTLAELREAFVLADKEMSKVWLASRS